MTLHLILSPGAAEGLSSQKAVVESEPADAAQETGKEGKESCSFFLVITSGFGAGRSRTASDPLTLCPGSGAIFVCLYFKPFVV